MRSKEGVDVGARGADRQVWGIAALMGTLALGGLLVLFSVPGERAEVGMPAAAAVPIVTLARDADALLTEEAAMRDPTPLFLPTRFNATEEAFTAVERRELSSSFGGFQPKLKYRETALGLAWPPVVALPKRPADAFETDKPGRPFLGFGQVGAAQVPALSERKGFVEVVSADDGELVMAQSLVGASPPVEAAWRPLQFLIAVNKTGVIGPPVLTESSQVATVDEYFQEYMLNVLHLGERLRPGFYRVGIGP